MNIAFVCYEAFLNGGIRVYTRELLNRIASNGHRVVLFAPPPKSGVATGLAEAIQVVRVVIPTIPLLDSPVFGLGLLAAFRRAERKGGRFEIVHSNTYGDALLPRFATRGVRITTVYHLGTTARSALKVGVIKALLHPSAEFGPAVALEGFCLRHADHLIAISEFTRKDVLSKYPDIDADRVSVIYPGSSFGDSEIDSFAIRSFRRTWGLGQDDRVLLYVGSLTERKGIRFLLQAFSLIDQHDGVKLLLVGPGNRAPYRHLARRLGIEERVIFTGYITAKDLGIAYSQASAYVHAALVEGFGLTVADAVATGLPVVATRVGSIPEIVRDGIDGHLVSYGDTQAFAEASTKIIGAAAATQRKNLNRGTSRFTWEKTTRETLALYERLISDRGRPHIS